MNEEGDDVSTLLCLSHCGVHVLAVNMPSLNQSIRRSRKEHRLDFFGRDVVLPRQLLDVLLEPDKARDSQRRRPPPSFLEC